MKLKIGSFAVVAALVVGLTAGVRAAHRETKLAWDDGRAWGEDLRSGRRTAHEFAHYINWNIYHAAQGVRYMFQRGFVAAYGRSVSGFEQGSKAYETAWQAADAAEKAINLALGGPAPTGSGAPKPTRKPPATSGPQDDRE